MNLVESVLHAELELKECSKVQKYSRKSKKNKNLKSIDKALFFRVYFKQEIFKFPNKKIRQKSKNRAKILPEIFKPRF